MSATSPFLAPGDEPFEEPMPTVRALPMPPQAAPEPLAFEGRPVDGVLTKVAGLTELDAERIILHTDDRVRMVVEGRVTGIQHAVDKDGRLIRTHQVKVIRSDLAPWDPSNPDDDGVLRA